LAGDALTTGHGNVIVGESSGGALTTGTDNTMVGPKSGQLITTGSDNTIIGNFSGNQGGLDIRTSSGHIVLSDGDGNVRSFWDNAGNMYMHTSGSGIYIGGASSANKLDDYEEGTFTPVYGASTNPTIGYNTQSGTYTKVGNLVTVVVRIITNTRSGGVGQLFVSGLPFTAVSSDDFSATIGFNYNWVTGENPEYALVQQGTARILLYKDAKTNSSNESTDILASGQSYLYITASYFAQ
jgi:hypothetical protein